METLQLFDFTVLLLVNFLPIRQSEDYKEGLAIQIGRDGIHLLTEY